jgi:hypothetical protein
MDKDLEEQFAQLIKKIDGEFRFTRFTVVLCCLTNIGILIFTMMTTFESLPFTVLGHYESNLDRIVHEWITYEDFARAQRAARVTQNAQNAQQTAPATTPSLAPKPAP